MRDVSWRLHAAAHNIVNLKANSASYANHKKL